MHSTTTTYLPAPFEYEDEFKETIKRGFAETGCGLRFNKGSNRWRKAEGDEVVEAVILKADRKQDTSSGPYVRCRILLAGELPQGCCAGRKLAPNLCEHGKAPAVVKADPKAEYEKQKQEILAKAAK